MAADTRPFKSKEQDGHGNEIIIRDQQLVEQTSQTTMASGEYFEIVDVDGRMAKIPKDNMIGVVREALGSLLNGLADQTTVAKFLTLNGNTLGASAAGTAASVLGVGGIRSLQTLAFGSPGDSSAYNNHYVGILKLYRIIDSADFYVELGIRCETVGNVPLPAIAVRSCYYGNVSAWYDVTLTQRT